MKNILKYLVILLIAGVSLPACQKDDSDKAPLNVETTRVKEVTYTSAICGAEISGDFTQSGICYAETENPTIASNVVKMNKSRFEVTLDKLESGKTYYVRAYATGGDKPIYGEQKSFTTYAVGEPIVKMVAVTKIGNTEVTAECSILSTGGEKILSRGFCYAKTEEPTLDDKKVESAGDVGHIISKITELEDGQTYYVKAYAKTAAKIYYSDQIEFRTVLYNKPVPEVVELTDVEQFSMTANCSVTRDNELAVTERGIYYGTSPDVTKATKVKATDSGIGDYKISMTNLTMGTVYYIRAYAVNIKGEAVSEAKGVSTTDYRPTPVTEDIGNIVGYSAVTSMSISALGLGGEAVTEAGVCWSTSANPTTADNKQTVKSPKLGRFTDIKLRWLKPSTTYHVRSYATNSKGTAYGAEITFTTREDLYKGFFRTYNEGKTLPYTNAIKYATDYVVADSVSTYQTTLYNNLQTAITKYGAGRKLIQLVYEFIPISDGTMGCQIRITYTGTDGTTQYLLLTQYKVAFDANGVVTFSNMAPFTGNAKTMYESKNLTALEKGYLDDVYNFLTKDKIILDWAYDGASTNSNVRQYGQIRLTHMNKPEENLIFGTYNFSYSAETPLNNW